MKRHHGFIPIPVFMYLHYHEFCETFCEVGSFYYQNSVTKSSYFVLVFMLLIIHTKMKTIILLQN